MAISVPIITTFDSKGITRAIKDFKKLDGATAKTGAVLANVDAGAKKFAGAFAKVASVGGVVAGVIGTKLVGAAIESAKVMAQTEAVIAATGGAAGVTATQVSDLSRTLSEQVGVDDEVIQKSANLLLTFKQVQNQVGQNNDIFNRAVRLSLDLGNVFGSTDAAAMQLGKALSDPEKGITALRRAGINFTEEQKALIKELVDTNRTLDAQKVILQEVESQVGGTAAATATDFDRMKVALGNVAEDLGTLLLPAVNTLAQFVQKSVVPVMQNFTQVVGKEGVGAGIEYLIGKGVNAVLSLGTLGKIVATVTLAFGALRVATVTYTTVLGALKVAAEVMNITLNATKVALVAAGGVTALLSVAAIAYGIYAKKKSDATDRTLEFTEALKLEGQAQTDALVKLYKSDEAFKENIDTLTKFNFNLQDFENYLNTGAGGLTALEQAAGKYLDMGVNINKVVTSGSDAITKQTVAFFNLRNEVPQLRNATDEQVLEFLRLVDTMRVMRAETVQTQTALGTVTNALGNAKSSGAAPLDAELQKLLDDLKNTETNTNGVSKAVKTAAEKFRDFTAALKGYGADQRAYNGAIKDTKRANDELTKATDAVTKAQENYNQVVRGYGAGSSQAAAAEADLAQAKRDQTRASIDVTRAEQGVVDARQKLADMQKAADPAALAQLEDDITLAKYGQVDAEEALADAQKENDPRKIAEAQIALRDAVAGVTAAEQALATARSGSDPVAIKAAQDEITLAELALTEAKNAEVDATNAITTAQTALNEAISGAAVGSQTYKDALEELNAAKETEASRADAVAEAVDRETQAKLNLAEAEREVRAARTGLTADQVKRAQKQTGVQAPKKRAKKGKAAGGMVDSGYPYIVGERGRELFVPSSSGKIVPNNQLGGGDVYNITINSKIADETLPDLIVAELRKFNRRSGALNIVVA